MKASFCILLRPWGVDNSKPRKSVASLLILTILQWQYAEAKPTNPKSIILPSYNFQSYFFQSHHLQFHSTWSKRWHTFRAEDLMSIKFPSVLVMCDRKLICRLRLDHIWPWRVVTGKDVFALVVMIRYGVGMIACWDFGRVSYILFWWIYFAFINFRAFYYFDSVYVDLLKNPGSYIFESGPGYFNLITFETFDMFKWSISFGFCKEDVSFKQIWLKTFVFNTFINFYVQKLQTCSLTVQRKLHVENTYQSDWKWWNI